MATVFLVEDNLADVELFRLALEEASVVCELVVFQDGGEIIQHIDSPDVPGRGKPDLIVLDLNLPKNDGLEVLKVVRECPQYAKVPIAILTSSLSARDRFQLSAFDICELITKPSDLDGYLNVGNIIRALLQNGGKRSVSLSAGAG